MCRNVIPLSSNIDTEIVLPVPNYNILHLFKGVQYNSVKWFVTILLNFFSEINIRELLTLITLCNLKHLPGSKFGKLKGTQTKYFSQLELSSHTEQEIWIWYIFWNKTEGGLSRYTANEHVVYLCRLAC